MTQKLFIYNTLSRTKELFKPLHEGRVGMYVCGPTVYGDAHLGHARPAITFDVLVRYLQHIGYKVRYVRNITDVGHLEHDADEGEDKIAKKARLEQLEPMEVAQHYTNRFHDSLIAIWTTSSITPVNWPALTKSATRWTSPFGKEPNRSTSCVGPALGATDFPDGTANARPWDVNTWGSSLTFTEEEWTWYSPTTNAKLHKL